MSPRGPDLDSPPTLIAGDFVSSSLFMSFQKKDSINLMKRSNVLSKYKTINSTKEFANGHVSRVGPPH